jgi:hypothetical protein
MVSEIHMNFKVEWSDGSADCLTKNAFYRLG